MALRQVSGRRRAMGFCSRQRLRVLGIDNYRAHPTAMMNHHGGLGMELTAIVAIDGIGARTKTRDSGDERSDDTGVRRIAGPGALTETSRAQDATRNQSAKSRGAVWRIDRSRVTDLTLMSLRGRNIHSRDISGPGLCLHWDSCPPAVMQDKVQSHRHPRS